MAGIYRDLVADDTRTTQVVDDVTVALNRGRNCLVLTQWTIHVERLTNQFQQRDIDPVVLRGGMTTKARQNALARLNSEESPVLAVATGPFVGEGFDCPTHWTPSSSPHPSPSKDAWSSTSAESCAPTPAKPPPKYTTTTTSTPAYSPPRWPNAHPATSASASPIHAKHEAEVVGPCEHWAADGSPPLNDRRRGFLFTNQRGDRLSPGCITHPFRRLTAEADLPPIRLHDLRHGAASLSLAAGNELKTVQAMLGTPAWCSPPTPTPACCPVWPTKQRKPLPSWSCMPRGRSQPNSAGRRAAPPRDDRGATSTRPRRHRSLSPHPSQAEPIQDRRRPARFS
jgi:hypothetical protein